MLKSTFPLLIKFLYVILGIILLSSLIGLFSNGIHLDAILFFKYIKHIIYSFIQPDQLIVIGMNGASYSIFPTIWPFYNYSQILFFSSFLLSILIGMILSYVTMILPEKGEK
ncbi:hypothetical protein [Falsibacillus pallidus]|uniref:Uncharacterized protein n=1 Tax=Falsibacillus pallidus TaxID=493781 RepID=A0A370GPS6_9BACI|nr:hypothetical protein [Falsibacillus pallidus]RDI45531.1 hypothetical protein DFR59_102159 [Falsibacillus pallidus]